MSMFWGYRVLRRVEVDQLYPHAELAEVEEKIREAL